jgi:hypothetical protein
MHKIQLFIRRNDQVGVRTTRAGQFQIHVSGNARGTVRNRNRRVGTGCYGLGDITGNGLLQQGSHIVIRGDTPRTGLVARAD